MSHPPMDCLKAFAIVFAIGIATCVAFLCLLQRVVRYDYRF